MGGLYPAQHTIELFTIMYYRTQRHSPPLVLLPWCVSERPTSKAVRQCRQRLLSWSQTQANLLTLYQATRQDPCTCPYAQSKRCNKSKLCTSINHIYSSSGVCDTYAHMRQQNSLLGGSRRGGCWQRALLHCGDKAEVEGLGLALHEVHKVGDANAGHVLVHHVATGWSAASTRRCIQLSLQHQQINLDNTT